MHYSSKTYTRILPTGRIAALLICAALSLAATPTAWSQSDSAAAQKKTLAEGDRLLVAGGDAYSKKQMLEASRLWEQARIIFSRELGEDHPKTLVSMLGLGYIYSTLGQHDKALPLFEQIFKYRSAKLGEDHKDTLWAMDSLAKTCRALGQHDRALQLFEQNFKLRLAKLGEDHPDTLDSMQNLASAYSRQEQHDKALPLFDQLLKLRRAKFGEDHTSTLDSMSYLASTYGNLKQHDKALAIQEQIFRIMRAKFGEDHPDTLASMSNLAETYLALGRKDKALALQEQTLNLQSTKLGVDHPDTLNLMGTLATTYSDFGQHEKARVLQEQTLKLMREKLGEDHPNTLISMNNLANTYNALGLRDKALALQEQTLKLRRAKFGDDHPDTLTSMSNLANTYSYLGQHEKALALQEQALKTRRATLGDEHPDTLTSMHNLATTYSAMHQDEKALPLQEHNLKLMRAKLGEDHPDTLKAMHNLASAYDDKGRNDKALALNEQVLKLRRAKLGDDHPDTLGSMNNLARSYQALGQSDKALALFDQTLKLMRAKLGANHPDTLVSMNNLAEVYRAAGLQGKALELVPAIISGAESLRTLPGLSTEQRQTIFAKYSNDYQRYAKWYADAQHLEEAFNLGDISKARTLTDSIKAQSALRALPADVQALLQTRERRARSLQAQIDEFVIQGASDTGALLALQKQKVALDVEHLQLVAELNNRFPKYAQLTLLKAASAAQAKQLLKEGEVFVSYLLTTEGMAQAFVLDASGVARWVDLGQIDNHTQTVAAYRELVSPGYTQNHQGYLVELKDGGYQWVLPGQTPPLEAKQMGNRGLAVTGGRAELSASTPQGAIYIADALKVLNNYWYEKLIEPVLPLAGPYKRWIISPDKDLALLPFDTLAERLDAAGDATAILAQTRNITLVQSFAVFALLKQREVEYAKLNRPKQLFAMGNAVYGSGWAENRGVQRGSGVQSYVSPETAPADRGLAVTLPATTEQATMNQLAWQNLPGTAREIKKVSAVFGIEAGADSYLGAQASEGKLQQLNQAGKLKDYRYLLFSAHGYLAQNSALSSLVLSQQGNPPDIDGYVTASEWPLYDVKSDLTVLSACDTGVGRTQAGESVMGLPYALFVAGNKNTLLSLWPVDDDATAEFMSRFFTKLRVGTAQAEALRQTKQEFMQIPVWSQPKFWAAFVLYGV